MNMLGINLNKTKKR